MNKFNKGQFIRWTGKDNDGKFNHVGQVISHNKGTITFATADGTIGVSEDDGKFEVCKKPRNWSIAKPVIENKPVPIVKAKRTRSKNGESKIDLVVELLRNDPPVDRKDAIAKIVAAGITTEAGASTYYNSAKKVL
jgi:hypothetical protein